MDTSRLFTAALQLREPWKVESVDFRDGDDGRQELHIGIGFEEGSRFRCPEPGCRQDGCPVHDTRGRVWRHLNFFQYKAFIHAGVPRVTCPEHGVRTVPVPWARPGSGFTLLFEAWAVEMARHLPVSTLAEQVDETDTRLWRFIAHYVGEARDLEDYTGVEAIGIDETSRKGHHYITVVAELVEHDVINVTAGKDSSTVKRFVDDFTAHNGVPGYVRLVTCDMSLGFRKGIRGYLPNAERIVDKFHVVKHANEAVDKVRKAEGRSNGLLKRTKYLWPRNESGLSELQSETKHALMKQRLKTGRACQMRETLQDIYETSRTPAEAWVRLHRLCSWMMHSRLEPMKDLARMIRRHWNEILAYFTHLYTNAVLEGVNSVIQNIKRRARGFRNMDYFATMVYLTCGKLDLKAVTA
ncbi:ISL3 family transposase [Bifidobacterium longum]|uniref:ISL3 family transposase n=1 Tax=Bifidobacterium longum TaxID=216816 RepID=UPI00117E6A52|nr:ISL3 family transposase [Bifidobacterium longum]